MLTLDNSYARSVEGGFVPWRAAPAPAPRLVQLNRALAASLGLDSAQLESDAGAQFFAGNEVPATATPIALAYAGHQFGGFSPTLGDGRALLLGELIDAAGRRVDVHLKGSGATPFARGGDGKATLGPMLREYLMGEAMHALGISTTRALAVVATGETVWREGPLPGAVLTRVAASHLRVGTFEYFSARGDLKGLGRAVDYAILRHDVGLAQHPRKALALLEAVMKRQAQLVARWMQVGFIHGVMNTDNVTLSGETIDYGPCAFLDTYHPRTVYSSIDKRGRYAFGNQPHIAQWNMARLAEALLPLIHPEESVAIAEATQVVGSFMACFNAYALAGLAEKLGLTAPLREGDEALVADFLHLMEVHQADFTLGFRSLLSALDGDLTQFSRWFPSVPPTQAWLGRWQKRIYGEQVSARQVMAKANPLIVPRNHRVEEALTAAVERGDLQPFEHLVAVLSKPFDVSASDEAFMAPPPLEQQQRHQTFCGT